MADLLFSYMRRKRYSAKLLAAEIAGMMASASLASLGGTAVSRPATNQTKSDKIPASQMLADVGIFL